MKQNTEKSIYYRYSRQFKEMKKNLEENNKALNEMREMMSHQQKIAEQQQEIMTLFYQEYQSLKKRQGKHQLMNYIRMRDSMLKDIAYYENNCLEGNGICKILRNYVSTLTEILEDESVEILTSSNGELFNPETQKPIKRIQAPQAEYNNVVYEVFNCGYRWNGMMLKKMDVSVCVYR